MEQTIHSYVERAISRKKEGEIIFPADFRGKGTQDAIKKALSRLAKEGKVRRLAHGIYYVPKADAKLGEVRPDADEVVRMLALKEHIRVRPAGAYALHRLGLTTQVPTKRVYLTDGSPRRFMLGKIEVRFKATSPKRLSTTGKLSSLVIQAIEEIGVDQIAPDLESKLLKYLQKEEPAKLRHDLSLAPARVNDYIVRLIRKSNDSVARTNI